MKDKQIKLITSLVVAMCVLAISVIGYKETGKFDRNELGKAVNIVAEAIETYNMSDEEVKELPSTDIVAQTEEEEKEVSEEQATLEDEGFEEQGEIAFNGDDEFPKVAVGNYSGLTYYSQIDSRWKNHLYTSIGNISQTIGSSGCGPTSASMVVTAIKGVITPDVMGDYFVKYGYRSADNGTYYSAFRWVADTFDIGYTETYKLDDVVNLLNNNYYVVASCGNGLFTTGGHFIVLVGIEDNVIRVYDPYLYAGKFETATRRGKARVEGNSIYVSIDNFRNYANALKFFAFKNDGSKQENSYKPVVTSTYTRYVKANGGLRIRNNPNGAIIGLLQNGSKVTVYETSSNWSRVGNGQWVSSNYLYSTDTVLNNTTIQKSNILQVGNYRVNASVLNVRTGAGTNYRVKKYYELTVNARSQNSRLGGYYTNGLRKGVITTVTKIQNGFGLTPSGWISLAYCTKI